MLSRRVRFGLCFFLLLFSVTLMAAPGDMGGTGDSNVTDGAEDSGDEGESEGNNFSCPSAELISGRMITDICWSCLFPVRVSGVSLGGGGRRPDNATDKIFCTCRDEADGIYEPGLTMSMWEPARIVELVKTPGCSPTLGGARLPTGTGRAKGKAADGEYDNSDVSFYHYHYYAFPILLMLDLFVETRCNAGGFVEMDLMYLSELDPTWNNDELAFFTSPEAAAIANPVAVAACSADAVASSAGRPLQSMFWCAGSWGTLYPLSGHDTSTGMVSDTNLLATKAVAALHRRGLTRATSGSENLCGSTIEPMFPKDQYKWSMFFPRAEAESDHVTGESTLKWGWGRSIPGVGEDAVYMLWRWNDCCMVF